MKNFLFLTFFLGMPEAAEACSVCFGNPESSMTKGLQMGITVLLGVLVVVLGSFALFFLNLRKKARQAVEGGLEHGV